MSDIQIIEKDITEKLKTRVTVASRGLNDFRIDLPFQFADGDALKIILKKINDHHWKLTDEGHTLMYLSYYDINTKAGERSNIFKTILDSHLMENNQGELGLDVFAENDISNAVFTFAQGLLKVSDMTMWKKERVKNLFYEHFRSSVQEGAKGRTAEFDVICEEHDPNKLYPIDSRILLENGRYVHIYAAGSMEKAKSAIISMSHYERINITVPNCVVLAPDIEFGSKTMLQMEEVTDKILSSPDVTKVRLDTFLRKYETAA